MYEWIARFIWEEQGDERAEEATVSTLIVGAYVGNGAWLDLVLTGLSGEIPLGARVDLEPHQSLEEMNLSIPELKVIGLLESHPRSRRSVRTVRSDHEIEQNVDPADPHVVVHQRHQDDDVWTFIATLAAPLKMPDKCLAHHVDPKRLERLFPIDTCIAVPEGRSARHRFEGILHAMPSGAGSLTLVHTMAKAESRLAGVHPRREETSAPECIALDASKWQLVPETPAPETATRIERKMPWKNPGEATRWIFGVRDDEYEQRALVYEKTEYEKEVIPISPVTIEFNGQTWFASGVTTKIDLSEDIDTHEEPNVFTRLELKNIHGPLASQVQPARKMLIGEIAEETVTDSSPWIPIAPTKFEGDDVIASLARWSIPEGQESKVIWAIQSAPGFVRDDGSAFYARWLPGDLVVFDVSTGAGSPALIYGALRRQDPTLEADDAADVALRGKKIGLHAGDRVVTVKPA